MANNTNATVPILIPIITTTSTTAMNQNLQPQPTFLTTTTPVAVAAAAAAAARKKKCLCLCQFLGCTRWIKSQGYCQRHGAKPKIIIVFLTVLMALVIGMVDFVKENCISSQDNEHRRSTSVRL